MRGKNDKTALQILRRDALEFGNDLNEFTFMELLIKEILTKRQDIDLIIEKAAPEWPIEKISPVDRNVLRIGLYELLFADRKQVPAKVAINEAIELAKMFGSENSGKFVNGVLGAVYKEIGEPGKEEVSKPKYPATVPYEQLPLQQLGGAVVYARDGDEIYLAMVHDVFGHWTLSKGRLEAGEDSIAGTTREIKEETGLEIEIKEAIGENEYVANDPEIGKKRKRVSYFLAEAPFRDLKLEKTGGLDDIRWFKLRDIADLNLYDDLVPIITKAVNILLKK